MIILTVWSARLVLILRISTSVVELVHSWLNGNVWLEAVFDFETYRGIYTDKNAIRRDEELDNLHSVYID